MKSKAIVPLMVGSIVGVFAVHRGLSYMKSAKAARPETVAVVVSKAEIPHGVTVSESMLSVKQVPKNLAPQRHFTEAGEIVERVTSMMIPADMPVMPTMLAPPGTTPGLGAKIPDGMRAVAVRVDEWSAVGGWLKPGVRVDVAAVFAVKEGRRTKSISKIILQNIEVAAVGASMGQNPQDTGPNVSRSVTLIVKPKDVAKLHLASSKGKIQLAMRGSLDDEQLRAAMSDEDLLLADEKALRRKQLTSALTQVFSAFTSQTPEPVSDVRKPQRCKVDVINGPKRVQLVYVSKDSMELLGAEGTNSSLATDAVRPYGRNARRTSGFGVSSFSKQAGDDDGGMVQGE